MRKIFGTVILLSLVAGSTSAAVPYTVTDLGILPGYQWSKATGINNGGEVVGYSWNNAVANDAFLYSNGATTDLGALLHSSEIEAEGINSSGQVVGMIDGSQGFIYSNGTLTRLGSVLLWRRQLR